MVQYVGLSQWHAWGLLCSGRINPWLRQAGQHYLAVPARLQALEQLAPRCGPSSQRHQANVCFALDLAITRLNLKQGLSSILFKTCN